ncbi:MAG: hypothetical protein ABIG73_02315 [Patescibacteria group bacterium]
MFENEHFTDNRADKPPKRLFRTIVERLKIEQLLKALKKRLSIFWVFLFFSAILVIFASMVLLLELAESESSPLFLLLFSDAKIMLLNFKYFAMAVLESTPIIPIFGTLTALALLMFSLRLAVEYRERIFKLIKLTK